jgi:hypothetical protein
MRIFPTVDGGLCASDSLCHRFKFAETGEQFSVEDGCAGSAANSVMREHGELPVED